MSVLDRLAGSADWGAGEINRLAAEAIPFFFMTDAWARRWVVLEADRAEELGIQFSLAEKGSLPHKAPVRRPYRFRFQPVDRQRYARGFGILRAAQLRGETWLANLTFPSRVETDLSLREIAAAARAPFRLLVPGTLAVFSPERFIRVDYRGRIASFPMKGTISADEADAEARILADEKEAAEHVTIVDLIRNDLGMAARRIRVERYRYITEVVAKDRRLLQVSSEIVGELGSGWREGIGTVLRTILPAGSVTGAPKKRTGEILREAEAWDRGWYAGVFGHFDGRELESAVSIRFMEAGQPGEFVYKSGGGVTINSEMDREYEELIEKIYVPFA